MLSESVSNSALPLIERVVDQGFKVSPAPNSPLSLLVEQSVHPDIALMADYVGRDRNQAETATWMTAMHDVALGKSEDHHAITMTDIVNTVANSVRITIDTARNKVNPVVLEVVREIEREFHESIVAVAANVTFRFSDENTLLTSDDFRSMIRHDKGVSLQQNIPSVSAYKSLTSEAILPMLKTNIDNLDTEIAKWASTTGTEKIVETFRAVFGSGSTHNVQYLIRDLDAAVAIYLIARHLESNEDSLSHAENIQLSTLRAALATVKAQAAFVIESQIVRFSKTRERGVVVHAYPERNAQVTNAGQNGKLLEVVVHRAQFDEFCKRGGNIEMIYGNILETDRKYNIDDIMSTGERAARRWDNHMLQLRNQADSRKFEIFKRAIVAAVARWIREQDDFSLAIDQIMIEVRGLVGKLNYDALGDIYGNVLRIVDVALFHNSDAVKFLRIMNKYAQDQPNLDNRHVATLAATEYTAAWVSSMLIVEK